MAGSIPWGLRTYGVIDRALTRAASFRVLGKSPTMILRNRLNRLLFRTLFARGRSGTVQLAGGARLCVRFNDQAAASLIFEGRKNDAVSEALLSLTGVAQSFFDVGANYGYFAIVAAHRHPDLAVVAVEPNPELARLIGESADLNGLNRVKVVTAACGAEAGAATLRFSEASSGTGGLAAATGSRDRSVETTVVTIDSLFFDRFDSRDHRPALIKIDVEGYEVQALLGAQRALATRPIIVCELGPATFVEVQQIASRCGLQVHGFDCRLADPTRLFALGRKNTDVLICDPARLGEITALLKR